jgi:hypothetical protein
MASDESQVRPHCPITAEAQVRIRRILCQPSQAEDVFGFETIARFVPTFGVLEFVFVCPPSHTVARSKEEH